MEKIIINGYTFEIGIRDTYLKLLKTPTINGSCHDEFYIDEFFESLGISRTIFRKHMKSRDTGGIFPEVKGGELTKAVNYLKSLEKKEPQEPHYEIY